MKAAKKGSPTVPNTEKRVETEEEKKMRETREAIDKTHKEQAEGRATGVHIVRP